MSFSHDKKHSILSLQPGLSALERAAVDCQPLLATTALPLGTGRWIDKELSKIREL